MGNPLCNQFQSRLINGLNKPPGIATGWDEVMTLIITCRHVYVPPLTTDDIENGQGMPVRIRELCRKDKWREPITLQRCKGNKSPQRFQQQTDGGHSGANTAECAGDEQGPHYQDHETSRTTAAPSGLPVDRRSQGSNSKSDRARLLPPTRKARRARRRNFDGEKSAEEPE